MIETPSAKEAYAGMSRWVNGGAGSDNEFIAEFLRDHNTLQSQVVSLWLRALYAWVHDIELASWRIDARNDVAFQKAQAIVELLGERGYQVPFI
jgi:hypothetical protein